MDRRAFIQSGVATGAAAGILGGCARLQNQSVADRAAALDMEEILLNMDRSMARLDDFDLVGAGETDINRISRQSARSLAISGMFRELPLEAQLHPDIQRRMFGVIDEMDNAVLGEERLLACNEFAADPRLDAAIKGSDNPGLQVLEQFHAGAKARGIPYRTRRRLRAIGTDVVQAMRHTSPADVLFDAQEKANQMHRMVQAAGSVEAANRRATARRVGTQRLHAWEQEIYDISAYWRDQRRWAANGVAAQAHEQISLSSQGGQGRDATETAISEAYRRGLEQGRLAAGVEAGKGLLKAGGWVLGVAATTAAVGGILSLVDPFITIIVTGTVGGTLLIAGLIVLTVGSVKYRRAKRRLDTWQKKNGA